ncbi:hypothetical protein SUGI_0622510 [Cryptomeria japonica]|nr:hypothetical protein SUGI_0622510 [Cryptomeria japonica]
MVLVLDLGDPFCTTQITLTASVQMTRQKNGDAAGAITITITTSIKGTARLTARFTAQFTRIQESLLTRLGSSWSWYFVVLGFG